MKQLRYFVAVATIAIALSACTASSQAAGTPQQASCSVGH